MDVEDVQMDLQNGKKYKNIYIGKKYAMGYHNGTKFIDRMRVRTPTFANLSGLVETLKGCDLADVPILVLTIDPCISCTER